MTATRLLNILFRTGYPYPINLFVTMMLGLLSVLAPFAGNSPGAKFSWVSYGLSIGFAWTYLAVWSRVRACNPARSAGFYQVYLFVQTLILSLIYVLEGGITRLLFVVVAVQAAYVSPARRWAPFLGTVGALWLTLYLAISPQEVGSSKVVVIGIYLCYLIFAALVTFTTVQQERQVQVAQELLAGVHDRHEALREYDLVAADLAKMQERERLVETIYAGLRRRISQLLAHLEHLQQDVSMLDRQTARESRLRAKEVLAFVREAVRTLRPSEANELDESQESTSGGPVDSEGSITITDPIRIYHVWNIGVIIVTIGVMIASSLIDGSARWKLLLGMGLTLLGAYSGATSAKNPWSRSLYVVLQAGLAAFMTWITREPLMNHLQLIVAAQIILLVPLQTRMLMSAVAFPTMLCAVALWWADLYAGDIWRLVSLTAAFGVTYFFSAVMAFMTRRQIEAREQAIIYAQQLAQVNRRLEIRLQEVRRMAIARERIRMAREIHDSLGHHLTTVIVELQYAEQLADEDHEAAGQRIRSAQNLIAQAVRAGEEMFEALEHFEHPLPTALHELVNMWSTGNGVRVLLQTEGDLLTLAPTVRVTLYRAVQESLTNIQKHASARRVLIMLQRQQDRIILTITNDDTGEEPRPEVGQGGFGLIGLRERADALKGEFLAGACPEGGFQVKLVLPLGA